MILFVLAACVAIASGTTLGVRSAGGEQTAAADRPCTVDELLPLLYRNHSSIASEWSTDDVVKNPYGCECSFYKAR